MAPQKPSTASSFTSQTKLSVSKPSKTRISKKTFNSLQSPEAKPVRRKRTTNPGVRLVNGRIYDSQNGTCCHQCRQKTRDFSVKCKNQAEECSLYFCHKCLLNRYGEKAEVKAKLPDWKCPICRCICNCSNCWKKQGYRPIGRLSRDAKEHGVSSVYEMLQSKDYEKDLNVALTGKLEKERDANEKRKSKSKSKVKAHGKKDELSETKKVTVSNCNKKSTRTVSEGGDESLKKLVPSEKDVNVSLMGRHHKQNVSNGKSNSESKGKSKDLNQKIRKRNKSPGVRVIRGRIYDSQNGKSCHQCRQKTRNFSVQCQNQAEDKQCGLYFCHICLQTRYGKNAEKKAAKADWKCPRCKGICNCSFCRKKQGYLPVGNVLRSAKERGFASVSEMLQSEDCRKNAANGKSNSKSKYKSKGSNQKDGVSGTDTGTCLERPSNLLRNPFSSKKFQQELDIYSAGGSKRGIYLEGRTRRPLKYEVVQLIEKPEFRELRNVERGNYAVRYNDNSLFKEKSDLQNCHRSEDNNITEGNAYVEGGGKTKKRKPNSSGFKEKYYKKNKRENNEVVNIALSEHETEERECRSDDCVLLEKENLDRKDPTEKCDNKEMNEENNEISILQNRDDVEVAIPQAVELTKVAKIDFATEDIGYALQFLEFCEAFGEVLDIEKGQPECFLQELAGQCSHPVGDSGIIKFHIKLLLMIQKDFGEGFSFLGGESNSWLEALRSHLSDAECQPEELLLDENHLLYKQYGELSSSEKLRLLTLLCDEALGSAELRKWMDKQVSGYDKRDRKVKGIERKKEREVRIRLQNELARAVLANNGSLLSASEHKDLVSKIKAEVYYNLAKLEIKKNQKSEALRLEPVLLDGKGCKFWKLKGHSGGKIMLLQECLGVGNGDSVSFTERWFSYNLDEVAHLKKYILGRIREHLSISSSN